MVDRVALGVDATGARARVDALEVATRHVTRAVGVDHALGPALRVGVAEVVPDALAVVGRGASALALGIEAAGRGRAGVVGDRGGWGSCRHAVTDTLEYEVTWWTEVASQRLWRC